MPIHLSGLTREKVSYTVRRKNSDLYLQLLFFFVSSFTAIIENAVNGTFDKIISNYSDVS